MAISGRGFGIGMYKMFVPRSLRRLLLPGWGTCFIKHPELQTQDSGEGRSNFLTSSIEYGGTLKWIIA